MGKKCGGYVPITEHAPRAAEALRKAVDGELLQAYRTPINDVLREPGVSDRTRKRSR